MTGLDGAAKISELLYSRGVRDLEFLIDEGTTIVNKLFPGVNIPIAVWALLYKYTVTILSHVVGPLMFLHIVWPLSKTVKVKLSCSGIVPNFLRLELVQYWSMISTKRPLSNNSSILQIKMYVQICFDLIRVCHSIHVSLHESIENWKKLKFFFRDFFTLHFLIICSVGTSEKGSLSLELSVNGVPGHSSMPEGETTIATLARAITRLYIKDSDTLYLIFSWSSNSQVLHTKSVIAWMNV